MIKTFFLICSNLFFFFACAPLSAQTPSSLPACLSANAGGQNETGSFDAESRLQDLEQDKLQALEEDKLPGSPAYVLA